MTEQSLVERYSPNKTVLKSILKNSRKNTDQSPISNLQCKNSQLSNKVLETSSPVVANFTFQLPG